MKQGSREPGELVAEEGEEEIRSFPSWGRVVAETEVAAETGAVEIVALEAAAVRTWVVVGWERG